MKDLLFVIACVWAIIFLDGCSHTLPATGPHHAGPKFWDAQQNREIQQQCVLIVLQAARNTPNLSDDLLPEAKAMLWDCLTANGQTF